MELIYTLLNWYNPGILEALDILNLDFLSAQSYPSASLQRDITPPTSVQNMTLYYLMVRLQ